MIFLLLPGGTLIARLQWLDSGVCAQILAHSFYPGGARLPLCARNTGIYLGFLVSLFLLHARGRGRAQGLPPWSVVALLACGVVALAVDGTNSLLFDLGLPHLYTPQNALRLITGLATGLAMAALTLPVLNRLFWREWNEVRSIAAWRELLPTVLLLTLCFCAVVTQTGLLLYPLALLSTGGLAVALSIVNLIVMLAIGRREQAFERHWDLLPFFALALFLALGELVLLANLHIVLALKLGI